MEGGPFGIEPALKAGGYLYAIIGVSVMPFIWSLPEALITYELSSLYPCASGGVRWTEEAFGEGWGLLVGYLGRFNPYALPYYAYHLSHSTNSYFQTSFTIIYFIS